VRALLAPAPHDGHQPGALTEVGYREPGPVAAGETNEPGCTDVGPAAARDRPTGK